MKTNRSIRFWLLATLAGAFLLILLFSVLYSAKSQRDHLQDYTFQYVDSLAKSYLDALNTMMVSGTMHTRETLRERLTAPDDIRDMRMIRSDQINQLYGSGLADSAPRDQDELDALQGQVMELLSRDGQGRVYSLIRPVEAMADYQGINCLACHMAQEGDILGAIRVDYSLAGSDARLNRQLLTGGAIQIVIFVLAFILTALVINRLVIARLRRLHDSMVTIAANADLSIQLEESRNDEIGSVAGAFNRMMRRISDSMHSVMTSAGKVHAAAQSITAKAEATAHEMLAQKQNTDQVASATTEMAASATQVKGNAIDTARQSQATVMTAEGGEEKTRIAVAGIETLSHEVQQGAQRIEQLNQRTDNVAEVLAVISAIAEQTNLLALNAAIEAARAGEQGRGFAVVADEVRALASRTQDSTAKIRHTIDELKSEAAECVTIMQHASELATDQVESILAVATELQHIAAAVRDISDLNQQMENAANEQSQASEMINGSVLDISQSAEQTSGDAHDTARIAEELLHTAEELRSTIAQFRLQ